MQPCLVSLGANLGDRERLLTQAMDRLSAHGAILDPRASSFLTTRPIGGPAGQGEFLNAAMRFRTALPASELIALLQQIENSLGRKRAVRWGPRTIDLDLLLYGDCVIDLPGLLVPHPRMAFRRFVLAPAAEVAPEMTHPTIGWSISRLLDNLNRSETLVSIAGASGTDRRRLAKEVVAATGSAALRQFEPSDHPASLPAGRSAEAFIEFWQKRAAVLRKAEWPTAVSLMISDEWFDQPLWESFVELSAEEKAACHAAYEDAKAEVVAPKLVVLAVGAVTASETQRDASSPEPPDSATRIGRDENRQAGHSDEIDLQTTLRHAVSQRGVGPLLVVDTSNLSSAVDDVLAAIDAMR